MIIFDSLWISYINLQSVASFFLATACDFLQKNITNDEFFIIDDVFVFQE